MECADVRAEHGENLVADLLKQRALFWVQYKPIFHYGFGIDTSALDEDDTNNHSLHHVTIFDYSFDNKFNFGNTLAF
jgi:hypothetical protein